MTLWIVGAGGLGRETLDCALACEVEVAGFLDEGHAGRFIRGHDVIHPDQAPSGSPFLIGIADPDVRRRLHGSLTRRGLRPRKPLIHPRAIVGPETDIGEGSVILGGAHVSSSITIGMHVHVNYNATVGHDTMLDDYVTLYPGANVSGSVHMETGSAVGSNACVLQGRTIGRGAFIGAAAVVTRDLDPGVVVVGSPARPLRAVT
jgi:sugar O-acyltransferase (sialic acid O-acetyltransferase NeuD family)